MLNPQEIARYQRQLDLAQVGMSGQEALKKSSVLVVGAGGLGCPAIQYLAAAGVGTIGVIDHDKVEISNLQRQVLYHEADLENNKADCAIHRIGRINPMVNAISYPEMFTARNAIGLCEAYDVVIDGTDNFETKYLISDATLLTGKPMVYASVYKFEGQLAVFNYRQGPSYRCVFPQHHQLDPNSCVDTGVLGILPGMLGTMQAAEALKLILGIGEVLSGKMKVFNVLNHMEQLLEFSRNEDTIARVMHQGLEMPDSMPEDGVGEAVYVDVREAHETPKLDHLQPMLIPLSQLRKRFIEIPKDRKVVVFCQTGHRSAEAVAFLKKNHGFEYIHSVAQGIRELQH